MELSSVFGIPLQSLYPDRNNWLLSIYDTIFRLRLYGNTSTSEYVMIMWTIVCGWKDSSKEFVVNHLVLLLKQSNESAAGWTYLKYK